MGKSRQNFFFLMGSHGKNCIMVSLFLKSDGLCGYLSGLWCTIICQIRLSFFRSGCGLGWFLFGLWRLSFVFSPFLFSLISMLMSSNSLFSISTKNRTEECQSTMALAATVSSVTVGKLAPLLRPTRTTCSSFSISLSKMGFHFKPIGNTVTESVVPTRKLVVRAARTLSQGPSLGFRPPQFQVLSHSILYLNHQLILFVYLLGVMWILAGLASRATYWECVESGWFWNISCFTGNLSLTSIYCLCQLGYYDFFFC